MVYFVRIIQLNHFKIPEMYDLKSISSSLLHKKYRHHMIKISTRKAVIIFISNLPVVTYCVHVIFPEQFQNVKTMHSPKLKIMKLLSVRSLSDATSSYFRMHQWFITEFHLPLLPYIILPMSSVSCKMISTNVAHTRTLSLLPWCKINYECRIVT